MNKKRTIIVGIIIIVLFLGWTLLENARYGQKHRLVLSSGVWVSYPDTYAIKLPSTLKNKWVILFFGNTDCEKNCSANLATLNDIQNRLKNLLSPEDQPVLAIANMKTNDNNMTTVVIDQEQEKMVLNKFKLNAAALKTGQAKLFVFDPKGRIQAVFDLPNSSENIALDIIQIEKEENTPKKLSS